MTRGIPFLFTLTLASAQQITIKTSMILDGKGHILKNKQITIDGSRIAGISDAKDRPTYDLSGLIVMPDWIDTHVHLGWYFNRENRLEQGRRGSIETQPGAAL
jgi:imidazolonepropionase-like amidohydrolase